MSDGATYSVERALAPPDVLAQMRATVARASAGTGRTLLRALLAVAPVLLIVYGIFALLDLAFGIIEPGHWSILTIGSAVIILPMLLLHLHGARQGKALMAAEVAAMRRATGAGEVLRHALLRDERHWFVEHEHGVMMACHADDGHTLFLDLSSITDDARYEKWFMPGRIHTDRWTWFTAADGRTPLGFAADGEALPPNGFEAAAGSYDPEAGAALFEFLGSPSDGDLLPTPFAEVDAWLRKKTGGGPASA